MKKIKFRAWDKTTRKMIVSPLVLHLDGKLEYPQGGWDLGGFDDSEHYALMQFTGHYDKNGKEIYEGDIVRQIRSDHCFGGPNLKSIVAIGAPTWAELTDLESGGADGAYPIIEMEIIGNIYENPDLLETAVKNPD